MADEFMSIERARQQVARYEQAVVAAQGDLDVAQRNLAWWRLKLVELETGDAS